MYVNHRLASTSHQPTRSTLPPDERERDDRALGKEGNIWEPDLCRGIESKWNSKPLVRSESRCRLGTNQTKPNRLVAQPARAGVTRTRTRTEGKTYGYTRLWTPQRGRRHDKRENTRMLEPWGFEEGSASESVRIAFAVRDRQNGKECASGAMKGRHKDRYKRWSARRTAQEVKKRTGWDGQDQREDTIAGEKIDVIVQKYFEMRVGVGIENKAGWEIEVERDVAFSARLRGDPSSEEQNEKRKGKWALGSNDTQRKQAEEINREDIWRTLFGAHSGSIVLYVSTRIIIASIRKIEPESFTEKGRASCDEYTDSPALSIYRQIHGPKPTTLALSSFWCVLRAHHRRAERGASGAWVSGLAAGDGVAERLTSEAADPRCPTPLPPSPPMDIPTTDRGVRILILALAHVSCDLTPCTYASASSPSAQLCLAFRLSHAPALVAPPLPQLWLSLAYVPLGGSNPIQLAI
ncbi:hypothetical protein B0H13DRAFT_1881644 [Mycena leptocephala]|nr:hypothetical protein B0H13DRAFT_1881644 [Mycena leptocephala]